nr:hypothetical protein [Planctomycetota bacterium]
MTPFPLAMIPTNTSQRPTKAWFIPGDDPKYWLRELTVTGLPIAEFGLYFMPTSMSDRSPNGLFVVLSNPSRLSHHSWSAIPYGQLAQLYLPTHCQLNPAVEAIEIEAEINFSVAVFHPGIGLVGFEQSEMKSIHDLIERPKKSPDFQWNQASSSNSLETPRLISVRPEVQLNVATVLEEARGDIGQSAIAPDKSHRPQSKVTPSKDKAPSQSGEQAGPGNAESNQADDPSWFKKAVAKGVQWISEKPQTSGPGKTGWFNKLSDWAGRTLSPKILESREDEIRRLLRMLDENPDEGLRYALPLSSSPSPSSSPGQFNPSTQLPPRTVDYGVGQKGQASDPWNLDPKVVASLREKYREAAKRELHLGRHRRAAYIFSELLGDSNNAALALMDGKHYLEAAMLYKDRMGQTRQAALCLSQGGYFRDAIELYESVLLYEQAGDLYKRLELHEESRQAYRRAAEILLTNGEL